MSSRNLSLQFIEGFVKSCSEQGLSLMQTESALRQHAMNYFLSTPDVYKGFHEKVASYSGELTKSQIAPYLSPEALAISAECQIKYASDPLSESIRFELGLPEPSWDTVPEPIKKIASSMNNSLAYYAQLPMNQKILIASLAGAGVGGLGRLIHPSNSDQMTGRGKLDRIVHGAMRGAATGAGVGAGSEVGEIGGAEIGGAGGVIPGMMAGGVAGGAATHKLLS